jgi:RNA polymerase sigma factor (sigma-70 family)
LELTQLIAAFRGPLVGLLASWGAPWADAVELAEETFAEAWLSRESCRADFHQLDELGPWLRGIARNLFRNWDRSRRRRNARVTLFSGERLAEVADSDDLPASEPLDALREAIDRLPQPQREVVLMHYLEETSVAQVAGLLAVSVKAVEGRLYQARLNLRRMLTNKTPARLGALAIWL